MGVREKLNDAPTPAIAGIVGLVVLVTLFAWWQLRTPDYADVGPGKAFYTVDDGKTLFVDAATRVAPFDHEGKPAVRAVVFRCGDKGGEQFVAYLERTDPTRSTSAKPGPGPMAGGGMNAIEIRRPGEAKWVPLRSTAGAQARLVRCPGGSGDAPPTEVRP